MKEIKPKQIRFYQTKSGKIPYKEWFDGLKDPKVRHRIRARLDRVQLGNLGDHKGLSDGVSELRFAFGSGYRISSTPPASPVINRQRCRLLVFLQLICNL